MSKKIDSEKLSKLQEIFRAKKPVHKELEDFDLARVEFGKQIGKFKIEWLLFHAFSTHLTSTYVHDRCRMRGCVTRLLVVRS